MKRQFPYLAPLCFLLLPLLLNAQQRVVYEYDEAGNRTARKVLVLNPPNQVSQAEQVDTIADALSHITFSAYPNPTEGHLTVEVKGLKEHEKVTITVYGTNGTLLYRKEVFDANTPIDISSYPKGMYILRIQSDKEKTEIKVIKK